MQITAQNAAKGFMSKNTLINIIGATGIGKTSLAIEIAKHFKTEIISSDSRQVYKEMSIGTAVPSPAELSMVKHHFIQHKSIHETYSAGMFERDALKKINELFLQKKVVVMVGGSGLYTDAVLFGFDHFPEISPSIREKLHQEIQHGNLTKLQQQLFELDPISYNSIDIQNPQRLIRALEICIGTGNSYASFKESQVKKRNFSCITIGLAAERETIYQRINARVDDMIEQGLLDEAKLLYEHKELPALKTVGYQELFNFIDGNYNLDFAISEIKKNTRRFAKRQITWNKKYKTAHWFDAENIAIKGVFKLIERVL